MKRVQSERTSVGPMWHPSLLGPHALYDHTDGRAQSNCVRVEPEDPFEDVGRGHVSEPGDEDAAASPRLLRGVTL